MTAKPADGPRYWHPGLGLFAAVWSATLLTAFERPLDLVAAHASLIGVGFLGAMIGNATAVGGGIVFIPTMVLVYRLDPLVSLHLALVVQAFGMSSGAIAWLRRGVVGLGTTSRNVSLAAMTLVGALVGTVVVRPDALTVKALFGPTSIFVGLLLLLVVRRRGTAEPLSGKQLVIVGVVALVGGVVTAWVAIGVGELVAAALIVWGRQAPERAIGLGVLLLALCSIVLGAIHALGPSVPWEMAIFLVLGVVFGGRCGPFLATALGPTRLKILFATIAIADGILFTWQVMVVA